MAKGNQQSDRRSKILELLAGREEIAVSCLISALQVSDETIRKDLIEMERQGIVRRTHGRAALAHKNQDDTVWNRGKQNQAAKERIAAEAVKYIPDGDYYVGIDVGSTTEKVAELLVKKPGITAVTNSLEIAMLYAKEENPAIYCTGGVLRVNDNGFYGHWTCDNLKGINMSVSILGTPGIMERNGLGAVTFDDRDVKKIYAKNSQLVIAVFDSTKCMLGALVDGVPWDDIDLVITDGGIPEKDRERIERKTKLIVV